MEKEAQNHTAFEQPAMIPCKDCLVYPVCKHKHTVRCNKLFNWKWKRPEPIFDHEGKFIKYVGKGTAKVHNYNQMKKDIGNQYYDNWDHLIIGIE